MAASRLIILGVAVAAAGGAGYVAKFMAKEPARVTVTAPAPAIPTSEVLVLNADVPMGTALAEKVSWQNWPQDSINPNFITRANEPDALEQSAQSLARVPLYAGEPVRKSKLVGGGVSFLSSVLPSGHRAVAFRVGRRKLAAAQGPGYGVEHRRFALPVLPSDDGQARPGQFHVNSLDGLHVFNMQGGHRDRRWPCLPVRSTHRLFSFVVVSVSVNVVIVHPAPASRVAVDPRASV